MPATSRIPVVLCVDVEPDPRDVDLRSPPPWHGFADTYARLETFRQLAATRTSDDVHFGWYLRMDPQIALAYGSASWIAESQAARLGDLQAAGDDVGLHVHASRWDAQQGGWIVDYADAAWIDTCLASAFSAFEGSIGRPCRTFRFGDHWMDQRTFQRLAALGVEIDLTIEPGMDDTSFYSPSEPFTGVLPDYGHAPSCPYRPSSRHYLTADPEKHDGIWELPVTTAPVRPRPLHRLYRRLSGRPALTTSTALVSMEPSLFSAIVDHALARPRPHLVLALRSGATTHRRHAARIEANLSALLTRAEASRFVWATPGSAIRLLQA